MLVASAMTRGHVTLRNVNPEHIKSIIAKLREAGVTIVEGKESVTLTSPKKFKRTRYGQDFTISWVSN